MGLNLGNTNIGEIYLGNTKIAEAYLGSSLVYQIAQPPAGYDSYVIHLTWDNQDQFAMAGLHIDGVQPSASDVTMQYYTYYWHPLESYEVERAIQWGDQAYSLFCDAIDITFTSVNIPSTVQVKTGTYWAGGSMEVTMHVAGVKNGVETDLGSTSATNTTNLIYTVNIMEDED